ncbi:hypothetical protein pb186bvf_014767 [Paramecium bursaria]
MRPFHVRGTERAVQCIKINYDGDLFFTGSQDGVINCWILETGERLGNYKTSGAVKTLDLTDNSEYLISGSLEGTVDLFQVNGGVNIGNIKADERKARWVELSIGDQLLLVCYQPMNSKQKYEIRILDFNVPEFKRLKTVEVNKITKQLIDFEAQDFQLNQASWGYLNESITASSLTGELIIFQYPSFKLHKRVQLHEGEIKQFVYSKDYTILATAANDGCKVLDPHTLEVLRYFKYEVPMNTVAISPLLNKKKPHLIVAGGIPARETARTKFQGFDIHICNIVYEEEVGKILNPNQIGPINMLQFFPDGKGFITGEEGGYSRVYKFDSSYWENDLFK